MVKENLIVFDIDDTLTSSDDKHVKTLVYAMESMGITNIDTDWRNYKHATDSCIFKTNYERALKNAFSFDLIPDFEELMTQHFLTYKDSTEVKGAKAIVDYFINETNFGVCFATGSLLQPALLKLQQASISFVPELLAVSNDLLTREGIVTSAINKAKKYYGVSGFKHIISFGDGLWDATTAKNLGLHFVGVNTKHIEDFKKQEVKYHINDWSTFNLQKVKQIFKIDEE